MTRSFNVTLDLGNDAMDTEEDVVGALLRIAARLKRDGFFPNSGQSVMDENGNKVGEFKLTQWK